MVFAEQVEEDRGLDLGAGRQLWCALGIVAPDPPEISEDGLRTVGEGVDADIVHYAGGLYAGAPDPRPAARETHR